MSFEPAASLQRVQFRSTFRGSTNDSGTNMTMSLVK